ncbi:MAG: BamA/TamA family outer membrane protein, partial [Desulfovibrio sp.]|nr:BamA/TamA family outer membrane protein [Desulfovibrio sp.]
NLAKADERVAVLPIEVELTPGPQHSVSASARYDSDTGFGVEGTWEHRNLFGNGEKLVLDAPISQQETGLKAHFEKPAFLDREQRLYFDGAALWENTDAYQQQSVKAEGGIYRRLARNWSGALSIFAEGGSLKDNEHEKKPYFVFSPRGGIRYDGRNNRMNTSKGTMAELKFKPFSGYYEEEFSALAGDFSFAAWYPLLGRKPDGAIDDTVVLAGRVELGAMPGSTSLHSIPASLRYYTGGAGTVRGYAYQSIGPRDSEGDPLGGRSYQVVNLEARFMVAENIGIVPFLDGGMVYREQWPRLDGDMDWGTGLGFRYYTPIGPVRLDVATPLHRIDDDPPVQFYISIGQSF